MSKRNVEKFSIQCPSCGSSEISKGDTPETEDEATCANCGERFSFQIEINKIRKTLLKTFASGLMKLSNHKKQRFF